MCLYINEQLDWFKSFAPSHVFPVYNHKRLVLFWQIVVTKFNKICIDKSNDAKWSQKFTAKTLYNSFSIYRVYIYFSSTRVLCYCYFICFQLYLYTSLFMLCVEIVCLITVLPYWYFFQSAAYFQSTCINQTNL